MDSEKLEKSSLKTEADQQARKAAQLHEPIK